MKHPPHSLDPHPDVKHINISAAKDISRHIKWVTGTNEDYKQEWYKWEDYER